jgi:hypothetical protein
MEVIFFFLSNLREPAGSKKTNEGIDFGFVESLIKSRFVDVAL